MNKSSKKLVNSVPNSINKGNNNTPKKVLIVLLIPKVKYPIINNKNDITQGKSINFAPSIDNKLRNTLLKSY